jgi:hypothetical protein
MVTLWYVLGFGQNADDHPLRSALPPRPGGSGPPVRPGWGRPAVPRLKGVSRHPLGPRAATLAATRRRPWFDGWRIGPGSIGTWMPTFALARSASAPRPTTAVPAACSTPFPCLPAAAGSSGSTGWWACPSPRRGLIRCRCTLTTCQARSTQYPRGPPTRRPTQPTSSSSIPRHGAPLWRRRARRPCCGP